MSLTITFGHSAAFGEPLELNFGARGADGAAGAAGPGVPTGGTTGQVLAKNSDTNYDTEWVDAATGDFLPLVGGILDDGGDTTLLIGPDYFEFVDNGTGGTTGIIANSVDGYGFLGHAGGSPEVQLKSLDVGGGGYSELHLGGPNDTLLTALVTGDGTVGNDTLTMTWQKSASANFVKLVWPQWSAVTGQTTLTIPQTTGTLLVSVSDTTALGTLTHNATAPFLLATNDAGTFAGKLTMGTGTGGGRALLLASNNAAVLALLGTGTPSASNFLRGDGSWQAVSASPGGSTGQIQWNNAGSFAGAASSVVDSTGRVAVGGTDQSEIVASGGVPLFVINNGASSRLGYQPSFGGFLAVTGNGITGFVANPAGGTDGLVLGTGSNHNLTFRVNNTGLCQLKTGGVFWVGAYDLRSTVTPTEVVTGAFAGSSTSIVNDATCTRFDGAGGAASNGIGAGHLFRVNTSTTFAVACARVSGGWADVTHTTRAGFCQLSSYYTTTEQVGVRVEANSDGVRLGFFAATAVAKPTGVAVDAAGIHAALVSLGLIAA